MEGRFGAIIAQDLSLYFIEPLDQNGVPANPAHPLLLERLGWQDTNDRIIRWFVRIEVFNWSILPQSWHWDDDLGLPDWVGIWEEEIKERVLKVMNQVLVLHEAYIKDRIIARRTNSDSAEYKKLKDKYISELRKIPSYVPPDYKPPE